ncbi:MAG: phosphoadenylyl-sulfate reductase [Acidobacteria bacterium]|nr:phosphoadenylyl-sulfate reductase [Acidobacteriota bacterium]
MDINESLTAAEVVAAEVAGGGRICMTCSFQAEDMVVLDLVRKAHPSVDVLFLETGYHFAETYEYRDRMTAEWGLRLINLTAATTVEEHEREYGKQNRTNPTGCCGIRKVEPLFRGLANYDVWFTGLRREQSPTRAGLKKVETHKLPDGRSLAKVSPVADWTNQQVWRYLKEHSIAPHPLYDKGYTSIGCEPCTLIPLDPNNPRSGRWAGAGKLECGIHTFSEKQ